MCPVSPEFFRNDDIQIALREGLITDGSPAGRDTAPRRYRGAGRLYDVLSLERLLYARPRSRLLELMAIPVGATVLDVGCGTGLNFPGVLRAIGPTGQLIGVDSSVSMIAAARRRLGTAKHNVKLVVGDATDLLAALDRAEVDRTRIDAVVATFVVSVLDEDAGFWQAVDVLAAQRPLRVGLADIGLADAAPQPARAFYGMLAAMGGANPRRESWTTLVHREPQARHEVFRSGHIHVAVATCTAETASR